MPLIIMWRSMGKSVRFMTRTISIFLIRIFQIWRSISKRIRAIATCPITMHTRTCSMIAIGRRPWRGIQLPTVIWKIRQANSSFCDIAIHSWPLSRKTRSSWRSRSLGIISACWNPRPWQMWHMQVKWQKLMNSILLYHSFLSQIRRLQSAVQMYIWWLTFWAGWFWRLAWHLIRMHILVWAICWSILPKIRLPTAQGMA